jgi:outer membrane protein TolC
MRQQIAATLLLASGWLTPMPAVAQDDMPQVTLAEALQRATRLDPNYVAAMRQVVDAEWGRRSAWSVFVLPAVSTQLNATKYSSASFNIGTGAPASQIVDARLEARYNLFRGLGKFADLARAQAEVEGARADELGSRFHTALFTEADYFDVVAQRELTGVASERVRRAEEQLAVARARVISGAAVQTDSLQLLLELTTAQVELIRQEARLKVARYQLGRRVGSPGPVDAAALDTLAEPALPITEEEAIAEAVSESPDAVLARANERAAVAQVRAARGSYLPRIDLFGQLSAFDDKFFPTATTRSAFGLSLSWPIWDNAVRELSLSRATTARDVSRAARNDTELALQRDVVEAYEAYNAARAAADLAAKAVTVADENLRVQQQRYRAGATTIIDLITAQVSLSESEAGLVQARQATRLALSGLEAILGRRLFQL